MYSGGARPFEGLDSDQIAVYVDAGGRLDRPVNCPPDVHQLMGRCWSHRPADRPSARQLFNRLADAATRDRDVTQMTSSTQQVHSNVASRARRCQRRSCTFVTS